MAHERTSGWTRVAPAMSALLVVSVTTALAQSPQTLTVADVQKLEASPADARVAYGTAPQQFGELRVPPGPGPHPVVVILHGGCWRAQYGLALMDAMAARLKAMGYATWNLEYRRIGDTGGGFPGTFLDVARGTDHLTVLARAHALDLSRVVVVGHSAGGHLALWLAGRHRLATSSPVYVASPIKLAGVVSLAGVTDLSLATETSVCGNAAADLLGGRDQITPRLRDSSPVAMLPLGVPQRLITGALDTIVPPAFGHRYQQAGQAAGDDVTAVEVAGAAHFEPIVPGASTWPAVETAITSLLQDRPRAPGLAFAFELRATVAAPTELGQVASGRRRIVEITGGTFEGPGIKGRIRPGGADWQIVRSDGFTEIDTRYTIETDKGRLIYVQNAGMRHAAPEVMQKLLAGQSVDPKLVYFRTTPTFETSAPELQWLTRAVFIGIGERYPTEVVVRFWRVE